MSDTPAEHLVQVGMPGRVSRRQAMQWVMAAAAVSSFPTPGFGLPVGRTPTPQEDAATQPANTVKGGYGPDPKLTPTYAPGAFWPLTFTDAQRKTAIALADVILPADALGPAASEVGVPAMIDEWISAPYPQQQADRPIILDGLAWLEAESTRRFAKPFGDVSQEQKHALCDDICHAGNAQAQFKAAAKFFTRFRGICASAYYATPPGWKAIGYVGNIPLDHFEGPPAEVLKILGVSQTVP